MSNINIVKYLAGKIRGKILELNSLDPGSSDARYCMFHIFYSLGRISELTPLGSRVYDAVNVHVLRGDWEFIIAAIDEMLEDLHS